MTTAIAVGALLCVAAGLVVGLAVAAVTRDPRIALSAALDLWLAAGLLRLAAAPEWDKILAAAAIIAVRQIAGHALRRPRRPRDR